MITPDQTKAITALKNYLNRVENYSLENMLLAEFANVHQKTRTNTRYFWLSCYCKWYTYTCKGKRLKLKKQDNRHSIRDKDLYCLQLKLMHLSLLRCTSSLVFTCSTSLLFHTNLLFHTVAKKKKIQWFLFLVFFYQPSVPMWKISQKPHISSLSLACLCLRLFLILIFISYRKKIS